MISDWVHEKVSFDNDTTVSTGTALDVAMVSGFGVVELESMVVWADQVVG